MKHLKDSLSTKPHLIWDFNGTILNDAHLCVRAVNVLLEEHALPVIDLDHYHRAFDFPVLNYYTALGFDFQRESFEDLSHRFHELYHGWLDEASVFDGIHDLLKDLSGIHHHVLSAAQTDDLNRMLERFELRPYFRSVYGLGDRLAASKVARGRELIETEKIKPEECLLIGDTLHDLEVGEALGIEVYLLTGGHQHEDRLRLKTPKILRR